MSLATDDLAVPNAATPLRPNRRRVWAVAITVGVVAAALVTIMELRSHYLLFATYQPLDAGPTEGNASVIGEPAPDFLASPGATWFALPYVAGRTVPLLVSIQNTGPYAVDILGAVKHELPDWGGRISIVGSVPISIELTNAQSTEHWPVRLPAHKALDVNLLLRTGNCSAIDRTTIEWLGGFQVRYRYAGVDHTTMIQLDTPIFTRCP